MFLILCYCSAVMSLSITTQTSQLNYTVEPKYTNSVTEKITTAYIFTEDNQLSTIDELNSTSTKSSNYSKYDSFTESSVASQDEISAFTLNTRINDSNDLVSTTTSATISEMIPTMIASKSGENKTRILSKTLQTENNLPSTVLQTTRQSRNQENQPTRYYNKYSFNSNSNISKNHILLNSKNLLSSTEKATLSSYENNLIKKTQIKNKTISIMAPPITPSILTYINKLDEKPSTFDKNIPLDITKQPTTTISSNNLIMKSVSTKEILNQFPKNELSIKVIVSDSFNNFETNNNILTTKSTTKSKNRISLLTTEKIIFDKDIQLSTISNKYRQSYTESNKNKKNNDDIIKTKKSDTSSTLKNINFESIYSSTRASKLKSKEIRNLDQKSEKPLEKKKKITAVEELLPTTIQTTRGYQMTTIKAPWITRVRHLNQNSFDKVCELNKDEGIGSDRLSMWYFNKNNGRCEWFTYNGKEGNGNRFYYRANCEHYCIEKYDSMCLRSDIVNCKERWLQCKMEPDLECHRNAENKDLNKEIYCPPMQPICKRGTFRKPPIYLTHRSLIPSDCRLPKDPGSCKTDSNSSLVHFYSDNLNDCLGFLYSNCGGNLNRFSTKEDCMNRCAI